MSDIDVLQDRARLIEDLVTLAWSDETFKALLLTDPAKALERAYGLKLPSSVKVTVLEETAETRYVVIPYRPAPDDLSDAELAAIAGGASATSIAVFGTRPQTFTLRALGMTSDLQSTTTMQTTAMC
jgi:hypothetical protein